MTTAFVLGNGVSRQGLDLGQLRQHGKIYGCNALHREFVPDVLVATDRPIATAIQESGYALKNKFYTRRPIDNLGAHQVPKPYFGYSSGPIAVALAAEQGAKKVYMLGFDMGPTGNNQFNNIYAGTEFYKSIDAQPTFTGNWVKQLIHITGNFERAEFVRICGPTTARISQLESLKNLKHLDLATFMDRINNKKDL
jgi:hypothetical protein